MRREVGLFAVCDTDQTWVLFLAIRACIVHRGVLTIMSHYVRNVVMSLRKVE